MEVICKPKYNVIFWKDTTDDSWNQANLDDMIRNYEDEDCTRLDYAWPVRCAGTDEILYYVYFCHECDKCIISVDPDPGYRYCPHCGHKLED